jgi:peptidoglycan/xylan/chitin deacetylase (PgdA/CDA1 family)
MPLWLITDVDTELDYQRPGYKGKLGETNPSLIAGTKELLRCFKKFGVKATFHIQEQGDPYFSILIRYPEIYEMVKEDSQEVSLHVHIKEADYETRKQEISTAFYRLKEHGYHVSAFKAGWYFTNEATIRVLEELGIKYDCSPQKNGAVGPVAFFTIPDSPYHPSYENVTRVGNAKILAIPITNVRLGITIDKDDEREFERMKRGVALLAAASKEMEQPVIIYFTTHSWKPVEVNSSTLRAWEINRRDRFFELALQTGARTLNVSEAGEEWEAGGYTPYYLKLPDVLAGDMSFWNPRHHFGLGKYLAHALLKIKYDFFGVI